MTKCQINILDCKSKISGIQFICSKNHRYISLFVSKCNFGPFSLYKKKNRTPWLHTCLGMMPLFHHFYPGAEWDRTKSYPVFTCGHIRNVTFI